jgi:uncharacterized protein YrzB (UPF0473 family)
MTSEKYSLLFIDSTESFNYKGRGRGGHKLPQRDREKHSQKLLRQFQALWEHENDKSAITLTSQDGVYVEFRNLPGFDLKVESLESRRDGIRLLNIRERKNEDGEIERIATVFIPSEKRHVFLNKLEKYMTEDYNGKPKNAALIDGIEEISLAVLESFWAESERRWIPEEDPKWCEIWLSSDSEEVYNEFKSIVNQLNIEIKDNSIIFPERRVVLVRSNRDQLMRILALCGHVAEMRRASEAVVFFVDIENKEQVEWSRNLLDRLEISDDTKIIVSLLDTGVNNGHLLLQPLIRDEDCKVYNPDWVVADLNGHGTSMSGVIAYGDLKEALLSSDPIEIRHKIESLKILPDKGENPPELYGHIVQRMVSEAIIDYPEANRILCMAVTAPNYQTSDGRPSSWSAAIDELTSGYMDEIKKLFIVSAGNNEISNKDEYPDSLYTSVVQNPGQSWNALTVGAYTDLYLPYDNYEPLAPRGGISPFSTTSYVWDRNKWPIKPDIVLEGGNKVVDNYGAFSDVNHSLLTTSHLPQKEQFTIINSTSASTALAARMAAIIQAQYPNAWPETIRGLLVHSAEWTEAQKKTFLKGNDKRHYQELARICGYGVPNLEKALWCLKNSVCMIIQSELTPFKKQNGNITLNEMHLHELPFPKEVLLSLGELDVKLRITLSYFIEPSPGERGWKSRYSYASCALRFDINGNETKEQFISRINLAAREEEEGEVTSSSTSNNVNWILGTNARNKGSIHSDIWETTASQLATSNLIGVYPISGWWAKRPWLGRWGRKIRYSLIVSISTPASDVDLYTPIEIATKVQNEIVIPSKI